jgi:hypothetical protein
MLQELVVSRGDTKKFNGTVTEDGAAFNLTGATIEWRAYMPDDAATITGTVANGGIVVTNAAGGLLQMRCLPAFTSSLANREQVGKAELQLIKSGETYTVWRGTLRVLPDIVP